VNSAFTLLYISCFQFACVGAQPGHGDAEVIVIRDFEHFALWFGKCGGGAFQCGPKLKGEKKKGLKTTRHAKRKKIKIQIIKIYHQIISN